MEAPKTLLEAIKYFSDEQICINAVAEMRWPNGVVCPRCEGENPYWLETQKRWKCRKCRKQFSVKVGSIFEDSPISLTKWLPALWLLTNCKNGISSYEVARNLGVTQKTAWFMLQRLRLVLRGSSSAKMGGDGPKEIDETFIGGRVKNMHKDKQVRYQKRGGSHGKAAVMGILDRDSRQVRATVVPNVKRETLQAEILKHIETGSHVYTDYAVTYDKALSDYVHKVVDHTREYVRGEVHTNGIENFWSLLKRGLKGTYVAVEPFHLDRYVAEQVFRFNNRSTKENPLDDADRFLLALSQVAGKRLTYAEVTGKLERAEA